MITVQSCLSLYRNDRSDISDVKRLDVIITHLISYMGNYHIKSVNVHVCRGYIEFRRETTNLKHGKTIETANSTIARELGVLRAAVNYCSKHKFITPDDVPTMDIPVDLPKGAIWLFEDELRKLYIAAKRYECDHTPHMYDFIRVLYITGSRRNAIETLEWSQLDFNRKIIYLNKPGSRVTKKRRPTIPMGDAYNILFDLHKNKTNIYVFEKPMERYRAFIKIAKLAGLHVVPDRDGRPSGHITPHVLRHTRATHLLENGMPLYSVARLLGDNPTTVERVYGHISMSKLESELEKYSVSPSAN